MKSIAFIDCFVKSPVIEGVNNFTTRTGIGCSYHMPAYFGFESLYQLPKSDAYIVLGSTSHVSENQPWHKELLEFIIPKIEASIPTLGICFGHQLIAQYYGCEVGYITDHDFKYSEVRDIEFYKNTLNIAEEKKLQLAFSHSQQVRDVSENFEIIATSPECKIEGLQHKKYPYWSFQAHPEASAHFIKEETFVNDEENIKKTINDGNAVLDAFAKLI